MVLENKMTQVASGSPFVTGCVHCSAGEESATVQVVVQLMAKQSGTLRQTPREYKLQTGKIFHMDSLPLFLDADDEINTLEHLYVSTLLPCISSS